MMKRLDKVGGILLFVLLAMLATGCISTGPTSKVRFGPNHGEFKGKRISLVKVSAPKSVEHDAFMYVVAGRNYDLEGAIFDILLQTELLDTGRYKIIERQNLDTILKQQKLEASDIIDTDTACEIGKIAGLDGVVLIQEIEVFNWVLLYANKISAVTAKLVDVQSGEIIWSATSKGKVHAFLPLSFLFSISIEEMAEQIAAQISEREEKLGF
ncbi:MAG: CsgG/HfaB family protein [Planctomycetota bacterium]|jgi:hypothetical protein